MNVKLNLKNCPEPLYPCFLCNKLINKKCPSTFGNLLVHYPDKFANDIVFNTISWGREHYIGLLIFKGLYRNIPTVLCCWALSLNVLVLTFANDIPTYPRKTFSYLTILLYLEIGVIRYLFFDDVIVIWDMIHKLTFVWTVFNVALHVFFFIRNRFIRNLGLGILK